MKFKRITKRLVALSAAAITLATTIPAFATETKAADVYPDIFGNAANGSQP